MKKLVSVILTLCLVLACVPAGAEGSRFVISAESRTLDLTGDGYLVTRDDDGSGFMTDEEYAEFLRSPYARMENTWLLAQHLELIKYVGAFGEGGVTRYDYSLDGDGTADIHIFYFENPDGCEIYVCASDNPSCAAATIRPALPASEAPAHDYYYWSPLTFILKPSVSHATGLYALSETGATYLKAATAGAASVKIPDTIPGTDVPVTKIADNAFKGMKSLTKATIGKNIKEIGKNAFAKCAKLKTVSGGANVEIIGDSAFSGCKALKAFTIGKNARQIGKKAFYKCAGLKKITIKSKLLTKSTVGSSAFKGIYKTATIKVPKAVKKDYSKWLLKKGVKKTMKIK